MDRRDIGDRVGKKGVKYYIKYIVFGKKGT